MIFIVFHGAYAWATGNWFPTFKANLEALGQTVIVPQFPVDNWDEIAQIGQTAVIKNQNLSTWLETFENIHRTWKPGEKICFIGHSVGCLFALHAVEKWNIQLDSAFFVCPFLREIGGDFRIDLANNTFYKTDWDFGRLKKLIPISYVLYSDNDPYVPMKISQEFGGVLESAMIIVPGGKHLNGEAGLTQFPLLLELCKTRIDYLRIASVQK